MSPVHRSVSTSDALWSRLEQLVEAFEEAWEADQQPNLDDFLPADEPAHATLLLELVHADLECRITRGLPARVETYVRCYPSLAQDRPHLLELIEAEFHLRRRHEPTVSPDEFFQRFPELRAELAARLPSGPAANPLPSPTRLDCPHCGETVVLSGASDSGDFTCPGCQKTIRTDPSHPLAAFEPHVTRLGKFLIEAFVGEGAFGKVYRAQDTELLRTVAVKVPSRPLTREAERARFLREAQTAAQLHHDGIVPIYEVYQAGDRPYLVSAFVEGKTLAETTEGRPLPGSRAAGILADVAEAVEYAHQRKIVHRDLKPSNIMLGRLASANAKADPATRADGNGPAGVRPIVMDFGLARREEDEVRLTTEGQVLGTPAYMSPEQAAGQGNRADARSDVWGLGAVLYELLTGVVPFQGAAHMVLHQICYEEPTEPRKLNDAIPRDLETITLTCLKKNPARRYPSAAALAKELRRYLDGKPIEARPVGRLERTWRWAKRNPWPTAMLGLLAVVAVATSLGIFYVQGQRQLAVQAQGQAEKNETLAQASEALAEQRLDQVLATIDSLVFDIQDKLDGKPLLADLRGSVLHTARQGLDRVAATTQDRRAQWTEVSLHQRLGDVARALGDNGQAREHYQRAFTQTETLRAADPTNERGDRTLSVTHLRLGQTSRVLGHTSAARGHFEQALALARTTFDQKQEDALRGRHLVHVLLELGDAHMGWGDPSAACKVLEEARARAENLAEQNPRGRIILSDLTTAHRRLGEANHRLKALPAARAHYLKAVETAERLLTHHPRNAAARGVLAESLTWLGDTCLAQGDLACAETYYQQAITRREEQRKLDPFQPVSGRRLGLTSARLADVLTQRGDPATARVHYEKALAHFEDHLLGASRDAPARFDLTGVQDRFGLLLRRLGEFDKARVLFLNVLKQREELANLDPKSFGPWLNLTFALANLGLVDLDRLDIAASERWHRQAADVLQRLHQDKLLPDAKAHQNAAAYHQRRLALCAALPQAIASLDFALAQPEVQVPELLYRRAQALAAEGKREETVTTLERLRQCQRKEALFLAEGGVLCATLLDQLEEEVPPRARCTQLALDLLTDAVQFGFRDLGKLRAHPGLTALRHEERFQQLLGKLESMLKNPKGVKKP